MMIDQMLVRAIGKLMNVHPKKTPEQIFGLLQDEVMLEEQRLLLNSFWGQ